jgi:hypothetical protein
MRDSLLKIYIGRPRCIARSSSISDFLMRPLPQEQGRYDGVCVCVCVCVCLCVCMCVYMYECVCVCVRSLLYLEIHSAVCTCVQ